MNDITNTAAANGREIATTRIFSAPRELVWTVWTDPKHLAKWWGPNGFSITTNEYELKPGGKWLFVMHGPDGTDYRNDVLFREVIEPEKIAYDHGPSPLFDVTIRFEEENETHTKVSYRMLFPTREERDRVIEKFGAIEGLNQTLGRLEEYLAVVN